MLRGFACVGLFCVWRALLRTQGPFVDEGLFYMYAVATVSRIDWNIGLFCRIQSPLQVSFEKETYNLVDPPNRSHPIHTYVWRSVYACVHAYALCFGLIRVYVRVHIHETNHVHFGHGCQTWKTYEAIANRELSRFHEPQVKDISAARLVVRIFAVTLFIRRRG